MALWQVLKEGTPLRGGVGVRGGFAYSRSDAPYVGGESSEGDSGMAETVKKAKAPAKPRKTTTASTKAKTKAAVEEVKAVTPSHEEIAQLAHNFWAERGWQDGYAEQDWLRAEQELIGQAS